VKVTFNAQDIVWAKVRGHAWWPAYVGRVIGPGKENYELKYEVHFIGDSTRAVVTTNFIRPFEASFMELAFIK
jgi:hypothetical protein